MPGEPMIDLDLATTDELLEALKHRFEVFLFIGERPSIDGGSNDVLIRSWGSAATVIGLCELVKVRTYESWEPACDPDKADDLPSEAEDGAE